MTSRGTEPKRCKVIVMELVPYCPDDVVDAATLHDRGLTSHDIERLCRVGRLDRLVRGWFAVRQPAEAVDRHLLCSRALLRHFDGRAAVSHHSRLLAAGVPVWRADIGRVHLTRLRDRGSRSRSGYRLHPAVPGLRVRETSLGPAVWLAEAIVQTGLLNGPTDALIAADAALHAEMISVSGLERAVELFEGRTGVGPVRAALRHADGRHESPGETRLGAVLRDLGIPATPQVRISTSQGNKWVDALLDRHLVVLEFDGAVKYRPRDGDRRAQTPSSLEDPTGSPLFLEKLREDAIRDEQYEFVRVVWSQLDDPGALQRRIDSAIARSAGRAA